MKKKPKTIGLNEGIRTHNGTTYIRILHTFEEWGRIGECFMGPGEEGDGVWSFEEEYDGTVEKWYGPTRKFYYILEGEFTVYYGEDADKVKNSQSNKIIGKKGDTLIFESGWKYHLVCTGTKPGIFLYGITKPKENIKPKNIPESKGFWKKG